ncbi:GAP family protein [Mycobacterium sp.]|uniref:GAP family protein n=1 Tax=Mycobacterium sp. TaxID=1785 RepID=UPI003F968057
MWGTMLLLALPAVTDPVRLGIVVLLISQPRPMRSLLAYWVGGMASFIAVAVGMLLLLRGFGQTLVHSMSAATASSTAQHIQIAGGLLALLIAARIVMGLSARQRGRVLTPGGDPSAPVLQPSTPTAFSRLWARAHGTLQGGSLWVAFVAGAGLPPVAYVALAAIAGSGAAVGTQLSAAVLYTIAQLAIVEVPLVSYLAMPARTQAVMLRLHNWVRARGREILAVILAVVGVLLVANGA